MKNELIKQAFRLGNSAGVLVPVEWRNKKVSVKLVEKSLSEEIIEILNEEGILENTKGIFLAGSYARGEESEKSDVDLVVITDHVNKQITKGKYEILLISEENLGRLIEKNIYLASLIHEAKAILNTSLLEYYKRKISHTSEKYSLDLINSAAKINEKMLEIGEEIDGKVEDGTVYSLVLRLRELYLIECIYSGKNQSKDKFISLIEKLAGKEAYKAYLRVKNGQKSKNTVSTHEARALLKEIHNRAKKMKNGKK